jgi:adenosylmethionine-8-amino-7-oxononanoate transaminase
VHELARLDLEYVWHPFTQMKDWVGREPIVITQGRGALLRDANGREYIDANSSIWTNLHGHRNRKIDRAIATQLKRIAHSSALGLANEPASILAEKLARAAQISPLVPPSLRKVFFSDDGSTAMEVALKLSHEYWRRNGVAEPRFLSLEGAYHGDTVGAVSLGHIDLFHKTYGQLLFKTEAVMSPYCYRCPFNRAKPERSDARSYRKCHWECVGRVAEKFESAKARRQPISAFIVEPLMQGAAGMIPQPEGWLKDVAEITRLHGAHLIADEIMTGFGRATNPSPEVPALFATQQEQVAPDFMALAKGLTGGYLPLAATLTTLPVFESFLGEYEEFKTFFHGHSYTGNQLASAAALASLELLRSEASLRDRRAIASQMSRELSHLWDLPQVGDIRQVGLVAGIELVKNWETREPFELREQAGIRVCAALANRGVLTRPIGNVIVVMPPYCATRKQISKIFEALRQSIEECFSVPALQTGPS